MSDGNAQDAQVEMKVNESEAQPPSPTSPA